MVVRVTRCLRRRRTIRYACELIHWTVLEAGLIQQRVLHPIEVSVVVVVELGLTFGRNGRRKQVVGRVVGVLGNLPGWVGNTRGSASAVNLARRDVTERVGHGRLVGV